MKLSQLTYQQKEEDGNYGASISIELFQWLTTSGKLWFYGLTRDSYPTIGSHKEAIGQLTNLQKLNFFANLQELDFDGYVCNITSIPESIGQLTNLQKLIIIGRKLTSIPESIGQLTNLRVLNLHHNDLTSIPKSIGQLTNLEEIDLHYNDLTSIPESIGQLTNLRVLNLSGNQISNIPESIGELTNLKELNLSGNQLTSLPESICQLTNLRELDLSDNQLTSLPESICQLANLSTLNLRDNQLTSLPESIGQLTNLDYILDLRGNQLTSLPESIGQLFDLHYLYLDDNPLNDLSPLQRLAQERVNVSFLGISYVYTKYWCKLSDWNPEWLLDEDNTEIRRILIQQIGYAKICNSLGAEAIDNWREYTLLKIDNVETVFNGSGGQAGTEPEPMLLLKMTCPSTKHIHILRVPPEMTSAEDAITWVNHGIHPDEIAVQT